MTKLKIVCGSLFALLSATIHTNAYAQTSANDIEGAITQGSQFDDARSLIDAQPKVTEADAVIDGEAGIFVLQKAKIFNLGFTAGGGYSSNPARTLDTGQASAFGSLALRAGVQTIIAQSFDAGINVVGSATEYEDKFGPSSRAGVANAYVGKSLWNDRIYLSGSFVAGVNSNKDFKQASTFYGTSLGASFTQRISESVLLRPSITGTRQWSGASEQNNLSATASAEVIWLPAPKWVVSGQMAYTYKKYDNFFEDVTFVKRSDNQYQAGVRVSRKISNNLSLSLSYDYTKQDSTFFLSGYDSHDGGLALQISQRF